MRVFCKPNILRGDGALCTVLENTGEGAKAPRLVGCSVVGILLFVVMGCAKSLLLVLIVSLLAAVGLFLFLLLVAPSTSVGC